MVGLSGDTAVLADVTGAAGCWICSLVLDFRCSPASGPDRRREDRPAGGHQHRQRPGRFAPHGGTHAVHPSPGRRRAQESAATLANLHKPNDGMLTIVHATCNANRLIDRLTIA